MKKIIETILQNWVLKQLTPANMQAILTAALSRMRESANETENVIDDWILDFFESVVLDPEKVEKFTNFIRLKLSDNLCFEVPFACDGPVNNEFETLAVRLLHSEKECSASVVSILQLARVLAEVTTVLMNFFAKNKETK